MKKILALLSFCLLLTAFSYTAHAQTSRNFYNSTYSDKLTDTTTNTTSSGSVKVDVKNINGSTTTIIATVDELSGTTAGTVTLYGSHNGTDFVALTDTTYVPRILTFSPADQAAPQYKTWILNGSPYPHYQIIHAGSGTMSSTLAATIYINRD